MWHDLRMFLRYSHRNCAKASTLRLGIKLRRILQHDRFEGLMETYGSRIPLEGLGR